MPTAPPRLSSFTAPQSQSLLSCSSSSRMPLQAARASAHSQQHAAPAAAAPSSTALAQQLHAWLRDGAQSHSHSSAKLFTLPSVTYLQSSIRSQQTAHLFQFLVQLSPALSPPRQQTADASFAASVSSPSSLSATRDQLAAALAATESGIDAVQSDLQQLQSAMQQQHRQLKQRQADEDERRRRMLLTRTAADQLTRKISRLQQWSDTAQRTQSSPAQPQLPALVDASTATLQRLRCSIEEAAVPKSGVESVKSVLPLLTALRQRHIELAMETQRLAKEAAEYDRKAAEQPTCPASASPLPLLQRDIAAHRAQLQYVDRLQAGESRAGVDEVRDALVRDAEELSKLKAQVSEQWVETATVHRQREQMRQAWQPHIAELQSDHQQNVQPLLAALSAALTEQQALMTSEWEQLRDLPLSITYRVPVQTAAGTTSTFLLPAASSSLHAVAAPWPALRPLLDAMPSPWYKSADTLLPSLVAHHMQQSATQSATRHHTTQLLTTLQSDTTLPRFPSLLASSADVDATHAATTDSLHTLHASLASLSQSAAHLSKLLQTQLQYGSMQLLPELRVDGRDGREWMEQLSGLEAKLEREERRAQERKEAQLREAKDRFGDAGRAVERKHRYGEDNYGRSSVR